MKNIIKTVTYLLLCNTMLYAQANVYIDREAMKSEMLKYSGKSSRYNQKESFPHDYFLIPDNLPYAFRIVLHHPESSELNLSKEKIQSLINLKEKTKPKVLEMAKEIKALELLLVNIIESHTGKVEITDEVNTLLDKIAMRKAELTKVHIQCILNVQSLLSSADKKKINLLIEKGM